MAPTLTHRRDPNGEHGQSREEIRAKGSFRATPRQRSAWREPQGARGA